MAEQSETTEYQTGNYEKLAPELVDSAYSYNDLYDSRTELARANAFIDREALRVATLSALDFVVKDQSFAGRDVTVTRLGSVIDSYGGPKDRKDLQNFLELESKLIPGERVLVEDDLYQIADANREPIFTIDKVEADVGSQSLALKRSLAWIAFGRLQGTEEIAGFPVGLYDALGVDAIKTSIRETGLFRGYQVVYNLNDVRKVMGILGAIGDTEGVKEIRNGAAYQAYNNLSHQNGLNAVYGQESDIELLEFADPEMFQRLLDDRALEVATNSKVHLKDMAFYEALNNYRNDGVHDPMAVLDFYRQEHARGQALIAAALANQNA